MNRAERAFLDRALKKMLDPEFLPATQRQLRAMDRWIDALISEGLIIPGWAPVLRRRAMDASRAYAHRLIVMLRDSYKRRAKAAG